MNEDSTSPHPEGAWNTAGSRWRALTQATLNSARCIGNRVHSWIGAARRQFGLPFMPADLSAALRHRAARPHLDSLGHVGRSHSAEHLGPRGPHEALHLLAVLSQANLSGSPESEPEHLDTRCKLGDRRKHKKQMLLPRWSRPGTTQGRRVALSSCLKFHGNPREPHALSLLL